MQIIIVGYTDSAEENGFYRLKKLNIDCYFKHVYVADSQFKRPSNLSSEKTQIVSGKKPNPAILQKICKREGIAINETLYLGDSLNKRYLYGKAGRCGFCFYANIPVTKKCKRNYMPNWLLFPIGKNLILSGNKC